MSAEMIGADPTALRDMAKRFDDSAHQLMGVKGAIQPWVDLTDMWLGLNYFLFKDMWNTTGARTIVDAASIFNHCADVLRANADAQDAASAADGSNNAGSGLFGTSSSSLGTSQKTPSSVADLLDDLQNQDPNSTDGVRVIMGRDENNDPVAVVYINGTVWESPDLHSPRDAILAQFGIKTSTEKMVREAMEAAGIDKDTKLLIVGYSQGGMVAQNIAASGDYGNVTVLTKGSPRTLINNGSFAHIRIDHPMDGVVNGVETVVPGSGISRVQGTAGDALQYTHSGGSFTASTQRKIADFAGYINPSIETSAHMLVGVHSHMDHVTYRDIAEDFDSSTDPRAIKAKRELKSFYNVNVVSDSR